MKAEKLPESIPIRQLFRTFDNTYFKWHTANNFCGLPTNIRIFIS